MFHKLTARRWYNSIVLTLLLFMQVLLVSSAFPNQCYGANYPLEIIQPQPNLTTANRFYKAYPNLEYNVSAGVIGGAYPFTYTLTAAPDGMTINKNTGVISWANPSTAGSPHKATLSVKDAEGTIATVSWTITVTTAGFYFVDAVNGKSVADGGAGTVNNPWKTIEDWYKTKYDATYQNGFLYFKSGTYKVPALEDGTRLAFNQTYKPKVWLSYPGESPVFDMSTAYLSFYNNGGHGVYVDGIDFNYVANPVRKVFSIEGASTNVVFRNNKFHGTTELASTNMAHIFISASATGSFWAIQNNRFYDSVRTMGIEGYDATKVLIEDNSFYNITNGGGESHAIGPKSNITRWDIRHNSMWNNDSHSIWLGGSNSKAFANNEIRFNVVKSVKSGNALTANYDGTTLLGPHYIYRNTFSGPILIRYAKAGMGPYYFSNNVIQNAVSGFSYADPATPAAGVVLDNQNLFGTTGIVDTDGNLIGSYAPYLGSRGWQLGGMSQPKGVIIVPPVK